MKRLLAFDFGTKRIGVAYGQTLTNTAQPLLTLTAKQGVPNWVEVDKMIQKWQPDAFVIGVPLNMDGTDQAVTLQAQDFANSLSKRYHVPIYEVDERLTTQAAKEQLFAEGGYAALQNGKVDQMAAKLILETWLRNPKDDDESNEI